MSASSDEPASEDPGAGSDPEAFSRPSAPPPDLADGDSLASSGASGTAGDGGELRPARRDRLAQFIKDVELWHDRERIAYATVPVNGHRENIAIRSAGFKTWLRHRADVEAASSPGADAVENFVALVEARAIHQGPCHDTWLRTGEANGSIFIDLADPTWRVVEIQPAADDRDCHWRIVSSHDAPLKFIRKRAMRALPVPAAGASIDELREFLNVGSDEDFKLVVGWLVCALRPKGPFPLMCINGEQGSGKSNALRLLRRLVDPTRAAERSLPKEERDLFVAAVNNWCLTFDNLSSIPDWLSDAFCRIATSGGFATRTLHSNDEEAVLAASRPILCNGIPELTRRADLADRTIVVSLPLLTGRYRAEEEYWQAFDQAAPALLGALFHLVAFALRHVYETPTPKLRMADAARWMEAAGVGAGWRPGEVAGIWAGNRREAVEAVVESDAIAGAIIKLLETDPSFLGTAAALLEKLDGLVTESVRRSRHWPSSPNSLGTRVVRLAPVLRAMGYTVEKRKGGADSKRYIKLAKVSPSGA